MMKMSPNDLNYLFRLLSKLREKEMKFGILSGVALFALVGESFAQESVQSISVGLTVQTEPETISVSKFSDVMFLFDGGDFYTVEGAAGMDATPSACLKVSTEEFDMRFETQNAANGIFPTLQNAELDDFVTYEIGPSFDLTFAPNTEGKVSGDNYVIDGAQMRYSTAGQTLGENGCASDEYQFGFFVFLHASEHHADRRSYKSVIENSSMQAGNPYVFTDTVLITFSPALG